MLIVSCNLSSRILVSVATDLGSVDGYWTVYLHCPVG